MDESQRLNLEEMLKHSDVEDNTDKIRKLKHSSKISLKTVLFGHFY